MATESLDPNQTASNLLDKWNEWDTHTSDAVQDPAEELPNGTDLARKDWIEPEQKLAEQGKTYSDGDWQHQACVNVDTQIRLWSTSSANAMGPHALILT